MTDKERLEATKRIAKLAIDRVQNTPAIVLSSAQEGLDVGTWVTAEIAVAEIDAASWKALERADLVALETMSDFMVRAVLATLADFGTTLSPFEAGEPNGNRAYARRIVEEILGRRNVERMEADAAR